jgi:hypothetical protein
MFRIYLQIISPVETSGLSWWHFSSQIVRASAVVAFQQEANQTFFRSLIKKCRGQNSNSKRSWRTW